MANSSYMSKFFKYMRATEKREKEEKARIQRDKEFREKQFKTKGESDDTTTIKEK